MTPLPARFEGLCRRRLYNDKRSARALGDGALVNGCWIKTLSELPNKLVTGMIGAALYLAWRNVAHEEVWHFVPDVPLQIQSCVGSFLGVGLAGLIVLVLHKKTGCRCVGYMVAPGLLFAQATCEVMLDWLLYGAERQNILLAGVQTVLSASAMFAVLAVADRAFLLSRRHLVLLVGIGIACYACAEFAWFFVITFAYAPAAHVAFRLLLLAVAYGCARHLAGLSEDAGIKETSEGYGAIPLQLDIHVAFYAFVFGLTHNLASSVVGDIASKSLPGYVGMLAALPLFLGTFIAWSRDARIWPQMRSVVFPITMLSFILLPLAQEAVSFVSIAIAECAFTNYFAVFFFASVMIAKKAKDDPIRINAWGLMIAGPSLALGVSVAGMLRLLGAVTPSTLVWLTVLAFVLLTCATSWLGDDRQASLVWGMEKKRAPKEYKDSKIARKCRILGSEKGLTKREIEICTLLVQGLSAPKIAEDQVISINTVRTHIARIHRKLNVHNAQELTRVVEDVEDR